MNILGLRNLLSSGILPVTKPYILFKLKDIFGGSNAANSVKNIKSSCGSGSNPNIFFTNSQKLKLPLEYKFFPSMTCQIFDDAILSKMRINKVLGVFTLDFYKL